MTPELLANPSKQMKQTTVTREIPIATYWELCVHDLVFINPDNHTTSPEALELELWKGTLSFLACSSDSCQCSSLGPLRKYTYLYLYLCHISSVRYRITLLW